MIGPNGPRSCRPGHQKDGEPPVVVTLLITMMVSNNSSSNSNSMKNPSCPQAE